MIVSDVPACRLNGSNNVSFHNLHVINVVEQLNSRRTDRLTNFHSQSAPISRCGISLVCRTIQYCSAKSGRRRRQQSRPSDRPTAQECRLRLKRPPSSSRMLARHLPFISSTAFRALAPPGLFPRGALLPAKNMPQHIFPFESELQNSLPEAAPSPPSLSPTISEKRFYCTIRPGASCAASR